VRVSVDRKLALEDQLAETLPTASIKRAVVSLKHVSVAASAYLAFRLLMTTFKRRSGTGTGLKAPEEMVGPIRTRSS
jgi:hypothetical protein